MKPAHLAFLNLVPDNQQFPAYRCSMVDEIDGEICMYGKTASSGVESMNQANKDVQRRTAVDILNAALVLIKNESICFQGAQSVSPGEAADPQGHDQYGQDIEYM